MEIEFIPLDYDYIDYENGSVVRIFGRTKEGKRCVVIDRTDSYFWLFPKPKVDLEKYAEHVKKISFEHAGRNVRVTDVKIKEKKFMGEKKKCLQVFVSNPKDVTAVKDIVKNYPETDEKKETDINYVTRYIIDKNVNPLVWHKASGKEILDNEFGELDADIVLKASEIKESAQHDFKPKILAFDIETSEFELGKGEILMISLADEKIKKVITWKNFKNPPNEVEFVKNEEALIERFKEFVKEYKPDFLVGYFSDAFDLPYLRARADFHKIKLDLGVDGSNVSFIRGILTSSEIRGIVHIDLYKFVNNIISYTLQSETLSLNDVAKELVGEEKLKIDLGKIAKQLKETGGKLEEAELRKFVLYNLQDSILASKLFFQLWPNIAEMTKIVQEPLFDVSRASYSHLVEYHILHNLKEFDEIAESRPIHEEIGRRRERKKYIGAYVKEPIPGVYDNIAVFDFRSFWPNIIVSFNISRATIRERKEKDFFETPEFEFEGKKRKFYFVKEKGFIPKILQRLLERRKETKQEMKKHPSPVLEAKDYALKTLSNATYGYFGFFGARYYSPESAASTTAIGRYYIHNTIETLEKNGFKVNYADTDSVMFMLGDKTEKKALELLEKINKSLPGTMELELENFYKRGIFVTKRTGEFGAKKKYALLAKDGSIKIRGFESVRRDRCELAKETQDIVLRNVLEDGNPDSAMKYVNKVLDEVKKKKAPVEKLIIRTQLKKAIEEYSSIGPHVYIAERMEKMGLPVKAGALIEYVIAEGKGKLIRERAKLPSEVKEGRYDIDYYINHQILPAVESILAVFQIETKKIEESKKQRKLGEF